jgi:predicted nucleotidyltransferase
MEREGRRELVSRITAYLVQQERLVAAYLFGSLAEETDHRLSDADVALLLPRDTDQATAFDTRLRVAAALEKLCRRPVDVVILNHAPPLLRFQVVQRGRVLVERDSATRCLFEARAMSEYYDARRYLDYQFSHLIRRIREEGLGAGYQGHRDALEQARRLSKRLATLSAGIP